MLRSHWPHAELDQQSSSDSDLPECRLLWNAEGQGHYEALIEIRDPDSDGNGVDNNGYIL